MTTALAVYATLSVGDDAHCVHRHELQVWPVPPHVPAPQSFHIAIDKETP